MKLASLAEGGADGTLVVVSRDGTRFLPATEVAPSLLSAIERWDHVSTVLGAFADRLGRGEGEPVANHMFAAVMPRTWQWLDGSAFSTHGTLMEKAFNMPPISTNLPLMYQGMSHQFLGSTDDVPFPSEADGIDFEGEFGVIVDDVPMGVTPEQAMGHIKLIVQLNDWSLRAIAPVEMKTGFGWIQAKPACSTAPFAVTPDEVGTAWHDGRVCVDLAIDLNGARFGNANGSAMDYGFHELIAHAARTRSLCAGTLIGSGTVSNANYREVGSSCIAERRAIELIDAGAPSTGFMQFGDDVRMEARTLSGEVLFGPIMQTVIAQTNLPV